MSSAPLLQVAPHWQVKPESKSLDPIGIPGGSGIVFEIKDTVPPLLIKVFRKNATEAVSEYYYSHLLHQQIPACYLPPVSLKYEETCTMTMPQVLGHNGLDWKETLTLKQIRGLMLQFLTRLQELHQLGLAHYDISPGNVMLKPNLLDPSGYSLYLIDFGHMGFDLYHEDEMEGGGYSRAPELMFTEVPAASQALSDLWGFGITCLYLFFLSPHLEAILDLRDNACPLLETDLKLFGIQWEQTARTIKSLMRQGLDRVTQTSTEDGLILSQIWHVLTCCLRIVPEERSSISAHQTMLSQQSFYDSPRVRPRLTLDLPQVSLIYDRQAFYYDYLLWDVEELKAPTFPYYAKFLSHLPVLKYPVGILAATVNLYLVYCTHCSNNRLVPEKPIELKQVPKTIETEKETKRTEVKSTIKYINPTKMLVQAFLSLISHLVRRPIHPKAKHFKKVEAHIVETLDWALLYGPFEVGSFKAMEYFPNRNVAKREFDLKLYL